MSRTGLDTPPRPAVTLPGPLNSRPRLIGLAAVAGVLVVLAVWAVAFSPLLGVQRVSVRGTQQLTATQVLAAADVKRGTPLLRLDTSAVEHRVERLPDVASASVRTAYPHTVVITVVERVALGYLDAGGSYVLVDRTGDQFRTVAAKPRGLPLLAVPAGTAAQATGQAVTVVAASLGPQLLAKVASIQAFDPTAITLLLTDGRIVRWGSADRSADKARILPTLLAQPGSQFDLTDPDQPFTR